MDTYFASPERLERPALQTEINRVCQDPATTSLLGMVEGCVAVLNQHRQILAVNHSYLELLGVDDAYDILGLRPGEAVGCIHAHEMPGGCGTSGYCSTCGAAVAIVSSLGFDEQVERTCCLLTKNKKEEEKELFLSVRCAPYTVDGKKFLLLFLNDITSQQKQAALERVFFHDISNLINSLVLSSELLIKQDKENRHAQLIHGLSRHLADEMAIQRALVEKKTNTYQTRPREIPIKKLFEKLKDAAQAHCGQQDKKLLVVDAGDELTVFTDYALLFRVLFNMAVNAMEGTGENSAAKLWVETSEGQVVFNTWNQEVITEKVAKRVFQKNFSTKEEPGRGLGTFSMKFFGEEILGGKVDFISSSDTGTLFRFLLPQKAK